MTGDRIIEVNGKKTGYFHEVFENIAVNPDKLLQIKVDRQGETVTLPVKPDLDKNTGAGIIGIHNWVDPVITGIVPASDAAAAGLLPGDRIIRVNGEEISHTVGFKYALEAKPETAEIDYIRNGAENSATLALTAEDGPGIIWSRVRYRTPVLAPPAAMAKGAAESWKIFTVSLKSLSLLFKGINLTQAVSGPVRITYMVGEVATEGFGQSFGTGLRSMTEFLALISIALAVMNLLPLPILDGGIVVLSVVEMIRRKPTHPKAIRVLQTVGVTLIFGIMIFALFGDIMYFTGR
jgi:regulator of sigma E protease